MLEMTLYICRKISSDALNAVVSAALKKCADENKTDLV